MNFVSKIVEPHGEGRQVFDVLLKMRNLLTLLILTLLSSLSFAEKGDIVFVSNIDGKRYEAKTTVKAIEETGGQISYSRKERESHQETYRSEPKGISLLEALKKADIQARKILGADYTGEDGKWILQSACRQSQGEDSQNGYYYRFSYATREGAYSNEKWIGPHGNLQIIVLLDGTVIETKKVQNKS